MEEERQHRGTTIQEHLTAGNELLNAGKLREAWLRAAHAIQLDPSHPPSIALEERIRRLLDDEIARDQARELEQVLRGQVEQARSVPDLPRELAPSVQPRSTPKLFICYRRDDSQDAAGRLQDGLILAYGKDRVFMDIDNVPLGVDFVEHVSDQVAECAAVIVMIGRQWLAVTDRRGRRRLDLPDDLVRTEIAAALKRRVPVIPVIVQNADMPSADELPDNIQPLARRNGIDLSGAGWRAGVERLIKELDRVMKG